MALFEQAQQDAKKEVDALFKITHDALGALKSIGDTLKDVVQGHMTDHEAVVEILGILKTYSEQ